VGLSLVEPDGSRRLLFQETFKELVGPEPLDLTEDLLPDLTLDAIDPAHKLTFLSLSMMARNSLAMLERSCLKTGDLDIL